MKENPALYEINTYVWLYELSQKYGERINIGTVPAAEWDRLKQLGFDYVWLMGIWKRSKAGIKIFQTSDEYSPFTLYLNSIFPDWKDEDITGSPYSIAAYEPDPFIGTWEDVDKAMEELHKRNIGLILDFVPNHIAPDHSWVFDHREYLIEGSSADFQEHPGVFSLIHAGGRTIYAARGRDPYFPPWSDTIQLNYFNPEMRQALIDELKKIAGHCDGFRCDMAMLVLNDIFQNTWGWMRKGPSQAMPEQEFWVQVRQAVPESLLMAEAYWDTEWTLQQMGFDYVYDKKLYDSIASVSSGRIYKHLKADMVFQKRLARFLENHDEKRSAEAFGKEKLEAVAALFATLPGMKLYHQGQIEGKKIKIPIQLRRFVREEADEEVKAFYERLLSITGQAVFHNGQWRLWEAYPFHDGSCGNLIAYTWKLDYQIKLVVVNMYNGVSQGRIPLCEIVSGDTEYVLTDELHGITYVRDGKDMVTHGLIVILNNFKAHIFDISPSKPSVSE